MTPITTAAFRNVMGHLPTGVTVITAVGAGGPIGMAANSVTSVSLDPPLILVCPARTSDTWPAIRAAGRFCVNVMAGHHAELTARFASKDSGDRFAGVDYVLRASGPALADAVAWVECELIKQHEAGDHTIAIADVTAIEAAPSVAPLVFFRGAYGTFLAAEA
jgi:flavin reductase (DIM6/NTAB) family NADH-FMN oxidoreductase RutF